MMDTVQGKYLLDYRMLTTINLKAIKFQRK